MSTAATEPSPLPSPSPAVPAAAEPRWVAGTLAYSSAGLAALFCWLLWGDFAWQMKERAITPVAQVMLRSFNASDMMVGLLVGSVPCAIGMVLGPVISVRSDRHRGRWGRRIPFLLIPTPIVTLSMFGLAMAPQLGVALHERWPALDLDTCRIMAFAFFWAIFEIATITINTLFGALINDVVPQRIIGRFFALFRAVGLSAGILFNYCIMGSANTHGREIFIGLALLCGLGFTIMCLMVKEGQYPPPPPRGAGTGPRRVVAPVVEYLRSCFTSPFYLCFFLAVTLGGLSVGPVNQFSVFHARSVGMSDDLYGKCLALSYTVSLLLAHPLGILADRLHPLRLGVAAMALYAAAAIYGFFFATGVWTFFGAFVAHTVLAGIYLTGTASIGQRLLPQARYAEFASAAGLVGAVAYMILPPALGLFLKFMDHQYRYAFLLGTLIALASVASYLVLFVKYQRLGGDRSYVAPQ
jgi:MFS family permease